MGVLEALLAYLGKSAGKVAQAIFGWAVQALFGTPKESEKTFLAVAVGAAAAWPLLLAGTIFPRIAAFVLAFVPIPKRVPEEWIRGGWIALAIAVPAAIGAVLSKSRKNAAHAPAWKRWLQGFPFTAALAAAFLTAFVTSPIRRFLAIIRRREDRTIPLLLERDEYGAAAELARRALERGGLSVAPAEPPWLMTARPESSVAPEVLTFREIAGRGGDLPRQVRSFLSSRQSAPAPRVAIRCRHVLHQFQPRVSTWMPSCGIRSRSSSCPVATAASFQHS